MKAEEPIYKDFPMEGIIKMLELELSNVSEQSEEFVAGFSCAIDKIKELGTEAIKE